jgi:hypothetical protein
MCNGEALCKGELMGTHVGTRFVLTVEEHFNRIRWAPGVTLFGRDVRSTTGAVDAVSTDGKRPLLVHVNSLERITTAAREILLEETCSTRTAVIGTDPVSMVITAFNYSAATPTRYFTDEAEAVTWLLGDPDPSRPT